MDYETFLREYAAKNDLGGHSPETIARANAEVFARLRERGVDETDAEFAEVVRALYIVTLECIDAPAWRGVV